MPLDVPGYYRGNPRYGSCDYFYVVSSEVEDGVDWGSYAGPRRLYWGWTAGAFDGKWFEAGEQWVSDVFSSSPKYVGAAPPDGVPRFCGDAIISEEERAKEIDRRFRDIRKGAS